MSEDIKELLLGRWTEIKKMKTQDLKAEVEMWRNIWSWVPSDIKYYVSRTGQQIGVQVRNYTRYVGILLETHWELRELEVGVYDKVYDQVDGKYYFERKIIRLPIGQLVSQDWIAERKPAEEVLKEEGNETLQEQQDLEEEKI